MNKRPVLRFGLDITGTEHDELQGILRTDGENYEFRSVLELFRLIRSETGLFLPGPDRENDK